MAWNPDTYNQFKEERFAPFYDLLHLLNIRENLHVIDLGCGTGELTAKLAIRLAGSTVLGVDASPEMLQQSAAFANDRLQFHCRSIERQLTTGQQFDLVFSNAAIQWVTNHPKLLPDIINTIKPDGQLLIQLPAQHHNATNKILQTLSNEPDYQPLFQNWERVSPVLEPDVYAQLLFENGGTQITVYEKIYPLIVPDTDALFTWVSGTALLPYLEKLPAENRDQFIRDYKNRLAQQFPSTPVFYPFKRILMSAKF